MRLLVGPQVRAISERTLAQLAYERLLARVRPNVTLEQPGARERLITEIALARQRVRPDVHLESTERLVRFVTFLAHERLLRLVTFGGRAVKLLVLREPRVGGVAFATIGTLVAWSRPTPGGRSLLARRRQLIAGFLMLLDVGARSGLLRQHIVTVRCGQTVVVLLR